MVQPADRPTSRAMLGVIKDAGAKGTAYRRMDGTWSVRLWQLPPLPASEQAEWLAVMTDQLEAAAGIRPEVETED